VNFLFQIKIIKLSGTFVWIYETQPVRLQRKTEAATAVAVTAQEIRKNLPKQRLVTP